MREQGTVVREQPGQTPRTLNAIGDYDADMPDPAHAPAPGMAQPERPVIHVPIRRLPGNQDIPLPEYQSEHAAGMDLHAAVPAEQPMTIAPGKVGLVPCGFQMAVPLGYEAQVRPRSGLAVKHAISMPNTPGTIDADYRGQVQVPLINLGSSPFVVTRGMRIAQMVVTPVPRTQWVESDELPPTVRGEGGFGHTGH
jgi:dUTP pyrophosphatase